jgi:hypothetical protein
MKESALRQIRTIKEVSADTNTLYFDDVIPKSLVYVNHADHILVWRNESETYKVNSCIDDWPETEILYPEILFTLNNDVLTAFAIDKNENLYYLGIPHYSNKTGYVCVGNFKKSLSAIDMMKSAQQAFYRNKYRSWTHSDNGDKRKKVIQELYYDKKPWQQEKIKKLKPLNKTIRQYVQSII